MAESQTEPAFMKFLHATIETLPYGLSDELLKTTPINTHKEYQIKLVWNIFSMFFLFVLFVSDICFNFPACHHFGYVHMIWNIANMELNYCLFVTLDSSSLHSVIGVSPPAPPPLKNTPPSFLQRHTLNRQAVQAPSF